MNKAVIAFVAGAAIGSVVAFYFTKQKCDREKQDEIEELRAYYAKKQPPKYEGPQDSDETARKDHTTVMAEKPSVAEYAKKLSQEGYTGYDKFSVKEDEGTTIGTPGARPYVISPDEFGEMDEYSKISLMYYADGVLCDDMDQLVDNIDEIVGADFADHFGEYEDDSVFVRNDARKCDYEILRSLRTYEEVIAENPYKAEV